jgi:hypothetical protein
MQMLQNSDPKTTSVWVELEGGFLMGKEEDHSSMNLTKKLQNPLPHVLLPLQRQLSLLPLTTTSDLPFLSLLGLWLLLSLEPCSLSLNPLYHSSSHLGRSLCKREERVTIFSLKDSNKSHFPFSFLFVLF